MKLWLKHDEPKNLFQAAALALAPFNAILLVMLFGACSLFSGVRGDDGVNLTKLSQRVGIVRQDVLDLAMLSKPETQERIRELAVSIEKVEKALEVAGAGGPISGVMDAADAAFLVAEAVISEMQASGEDVGNLPLYVGLGRIVMRHLSLGDVEEAEEVLEGEQDPQPVVEPAEAIEPTP